MPRDSFTSCEMDKLTEEGDGRPDMSVFSTEDLRVLLFTIEQECAKHRRARRRLMRELRKRGEV